MAVNVEILLDRFTDIDHALATLKKRMLKEGTFLEMKKRAYHETRSEKRRRKSKLARKKVRKAQKKREEYDAKFENVKRRQDDPLRGVIA